MPPSARCVSATVAEHHAQIGPVEVRSPERCLRLLAQLNVQVRRRHERGVHHDHVSFDRTFKIEKIRCPETHSCRICGVVVFQGKTSHLNCISGEIESDKFHPALKALSLQRPRGFGKENP